ncbi:hypothetical protein [uncultured Draconibacterium sp.]|uniref:hypothetical protein n=1 Tax=uncultured Draconibacterium sp. TaxID=1573823 RepID=UPI0025D18346|nr:hypothetical protein [uncultured Draconibacterium sp.]
MSNIITYKIFPEIKLVLELAIGELHYKPFEDYKRRLIDDSAFDSSFNHLSVFYHSEFCFAKEDIENYKNFLAENKKVIGDRKVAVLTSAPKHVAISTIYANAVKDLPMNFMIFSTYKAALSWLDIPLEYESKFTQVINDIASS